MKNTIPIIRDALFAAFFFVGLSANGQSQEKSYTTLILSFSRGIVWPTNVLSDKFVIGVLEYPPLAAELTQATKSFKVQNRKIEVRELHTIEDMTSCQVLFIPAFKAKELSDVIAALGSSPTLIITNKYNLARKGSGVNFVLINGKLHYEINSKAIEARGLKISAGIKGMGIEVN